MSLVDLNYNFECDWLIELSDNCMPEKRDIRQFHHVHDFFSKLGNGEYIYIYIYIYI